MALGSWTPPPREPEGPTCSHTYKHHIAKIPGTGKIVVVGYMGGRAENFHCGCYRTDTPRNPTSERGKW